MRQRRTLAGNLTIGARLNRLGMWNRLALVLAIIICIVVPFRWYVDHSNQLSADLQRMDEWCSDPDSAAGFRDPISLKPKTTCAEMREKVATRGRAKLDDGFGIILSMTIFACLLAYGAIWSVVNIGKWVFAGRNVGKGES